MSKYQARIPIGERMHAWRVLQQLWAEINASRQSVNAGTKLKVDALMWAVRDLQRRFFGVSL
jgi:hypothetical protein